MRATVRVEDPFSYAVFLDLEGTLFDIASAPHLVCIPSDLVPLLPAFKGRRPIMVGDDVPDESALTAAIRCGGYGLRVAGEHFKGQADFEGPADVGLACINSRRP